MTYRIHQYSEFDAEQAAKEIFQRALKSFPELPQEEKGWSPSEWAAFVNRIDQYLPGLLRLFFEMYQDCFDAYPVFEELVRQLIASWLDRKPALRALDETRRQQPDWFQSSQQLGGVCYVDLYAGTLGRLREKLPYFEELGLTYLHLMPLFAAPEGENDGGYAISDYRQVDPRMGSIEQLEGLITEFHQHGISIALDFVFNHTSSDHAWALAAKAGDPVHQGYYWMFPDRELPDLFEKTLREIFPDEHPGAFTWYPELEKWVWTTFHSYQWDLNYQNPIVFLRMAEEMLFLANLGVDVMRLDAVAFIWKTLGTTCESQPNAFKLVEAFNLVARIAAPAMIFKSEAIVHPDQVSQYILPERCQLSYNPLLMALLWEALATRQVKLLAHSLDKRFQLPEDTAWVNYLRCHDDIGWTFSDEDAAEVRINGWGHRRFLNQFYTGEFLGTFARGLPFQLNPKTGDCRISGMLSSLAGLEAAVEKAEPAEIELSIARIHLLFGIILTIGGLPLIYLGDELGKLNDYDFLNDPNKKEDSRWVHRLPFDQALFEKRSEMNGTAEKIYNGIKELIQLRKSHPLFGNNDLRIVLSGNEHILAFEKRDENEKVLCLGNFSEKN